MDEQRIKRRRVLQWGLGATTLVAGAGGASWLALHRQPPVTKTVQHTNHVIRWNQAALEAIRHTRPGPPIVARALAILHTCIYDAWAAYTSAATGTTFGDQVRRPASERTQDNKQQAISYAAYRALSDLFPAEKASLRGLLIAMGYNPDDHTRDTATPAGIGNVVAQAVLDVRHHDGANQLGDLHPGAYSDYTGYKPVNDIDHLRNPDYWQPLRVPDGHGHTTVQQFIAPQWSRIVPFSLTSGAQFRPALHPATYPSETYTRQAEQLVGYSSGLNDTHKVITEYWMDGPGSAQPPGHWCLLGQWISLRDRHGLDQDVVLFFALTNALFDASIACWDVKRVYDSVRPITAIRYLFRDKQIRAWAGPYQGTRLRAGQTWQPYQPLTVVTPPFPEYCSGHSTFSAAAAEILRSFTGSERFGASYIQRAKTSIIEPGRTPASDVTLSWATFSAAADQAGMSRRYGGIHFEQADLTGRTLGRRVGAHVWQTVQQYLYAK